MLCSKSDLYQKLKSNLKLEERCKSDRGGLVGERELREALEEVGSQLAPVGMTAMIRRICGTRESDETPKAIDARKLRDYFLKLKLDKQIKWEEWRERKAEIDELEYKLKQGEFEKALDGKRFTLDESDYNKLIKDFK